MKYIYASRTGNVEKLIQSLGLEAKKLADGTEKAEGDFILFTYTDGRGIVPPVVEQFLKENHSLLKGVVVSGNMQRHGDQIALRMIAEEQPDSAAVAVKPNLEDVFLYYFGGDSV